MVRDKLLMMKDKLTKSEYKKLINELGGFTPSKFTLSTNKFPAKAQKLIEEKYSKDKAEDILKNAVYIETVSSTGDLNRNGYIIRANAWKSKDENGVSAIDRYLENPVVLFQHESELIIGETLWAKVSGNELKTGLYIYTDQFPTEQDKLRFERGQLKMLSTGHITLAVEWENAETGEVLSDEKAQEEVGFWELLFSPVWKMAVTALDFVEQSLVTIGSNKSAFITNDMNGNSVMINNEEAKLNWFRNFSKFKDIKEAQRYLELKNNPTPETKEEFEKLQNKFLTLQKKNNEIILDSNNPKAMKKIVTNSEEAETPTTPVEEEKLEKTAEEPVSEEVTEATENVEETPATNELETHSRDELEKGKTVLNNALVLLNKKIAEKSEDNSIELSKLETEKNELEASQNKLLEEVNSSLEKLKVEKLENFSEIGVCFNELAEQFGKYREILVNTPQPKSVKVQIPHEPNSISPKKEEKNNSPFIRKFAEKGLL